MDFKLVVILTFVSKGTDGLYISQKNLSYCFPNNAEQGLLLGRVFAHTNISSDCSETDLEYELRTSGEPSYFMQYFEITGSGWIRLASPLDDRAKGQISFNFLLKVKCKSESSREPLVVPVTLRPQTPSLTGSIQKDDMRRYCFGDIPKTFQIEENVENISLGLLRGCSDTIFNSSSGGITKGIVNGNFSHHFLLDPNTSELRVVEHLDREAVKLVLLSVICNSTGPVPSSVTETVRIEILDVNDNLPYFEKTGSRSKEVDCNVTETQCRIIGEVVIDRDEEQAVPHTVEILDDPFGVCRPAQPVCYLVKNSRFCRLGITTEGLETLPEPVYTCTAALVDKSYVGLSDEQYNKSAVMKINFHNSAVVKLSPTYQTEQKFVQFYRNATRLARLLELSESLKKRKQYSLANPIFRVTPNYGIVYVYDDTALRQATDFVSVQVKASSSLLINITVQMQGAPRKDTKGCESNCSRKTSLEKCESSCGLGITTSNCVYRKVENDKKYTQHLKTYETCSYNTSTCPDHRCDELEELNPGLCPQDCTTNTIIGVGFLDESSKGIGSCMSPAWCNRDAQCFCVQVPTSTESFQPQTQKHGQPIDTLEITTVVEANNTSMERQVTAIFSDSDNEICDHYCRAVIGASLGSLACFLLILIVLWIIKRKRKGRRSNLKHVGSLLSIPAVPSDYVVDRERQSSYPSPIWAPKQPVMASMRQEDLKWEFPRENLYLEDALGEGEFGVVMKAKAKGLDGQEGYTQVAIKMLKHCSTPSEEQDLWSEFNLLKDVTHPNVIRLLGACTKDGPLYLIVEYCVNGCLLNYLRNSCLEDSGYVNQHVSYRTPNNNNKEIRQNGETLTARDLLSFAWQIAKGMRYLSDIKLVHRDLAARNVLVAAGKHLKISDFGLTRDIYEADAYLKKSRGRIPVKWMAPESLYAQIYTTKSDVWSYGIVLWELVTLGASPYPGIPPERLYSLLMGGYRMDRPEHCPEEMYAIMQKCWKMDPQDRPKFRVIADILDRILQEKTGYLDLNAGLGENLVNQLLEDRICSTEKEHPGRNNLNKKKQDVDELGSSFSSSSTYLTPSSNFHPDGEEKSSSPLFGRKNVIYPSEKKTFLKDMGTVKFINVDRQLTDSVEELEPLTFGAS